MASVGFRTFDRKFIGQKRLDGKYDFKFFFDRPAIDRALDAKTKRVLTGVGGYIRKAVRNSMTAPNKTAKRKYYETLVAFSRRQATAKQLEAARRKTASKPGDPPFYHSRLLKDRIYFAYERSTRSVVIGPVRFDSSHTKAMGGKTGAELLEKGGKAMFLRSHMKYDAYIEPRPYMAPQQALAQRKFTEFMRQENL